MTTRPDQDQIIDAGGITLAYRETGDPHAEPLLLINGFGAQLIGWHPRFRTLLAARGYRVLAMDNRDVGRSQAFPGVQYDLTDMAGDCVAFLNALGIDRAHIVGQSAGGMIAQEMAVEHPDRVASLALLYTAADYEPYRIGGEHRATREALPTPTTAAEAADNHVLNEQACASDDYPQDVAWIRTVGATMYDRGVDLGGMARQRRAIDTSRTRGQLIHQITAPTVIIHGRGDKLIDYHAAIAIAEQVPHSSLHLLAGLGHEINQAVEGIVAELICTNAYRTTSTLVDIDAS
jgi:pimeloyl-ACP methyl ester carboxylesterase